MIKEVHDKDYLDRLKELNLWTLEERRNRADLTHINPWWNSIVICSYLSLLGYIGIITNKILNILEDFR